MFAQADLMGYCLPRKYNGLNFPAIMLSVAAEIVSRADGSFLNFGLQQDIGETLNKFGSEKQRQEVLPRLASGEWGCSMILTEPDAGSDLQAVNLRATQDANGNWFLNGVKRFITNGNGTVGLVLARSEDGQTGARGLSFFLYKRDEHMKIRRVEHKFGIHGSPTCELQFNNAPCTLVGERKRGLSKYTMWLMNSARIGIAAQALGIAEAAWREGDKYSKERIQFGKAIREFPAVYEMLTENKVAIEAGRTLLYETAKFVDIKECIEETLEKYPEKAPEYKTDLKRYTRLAALFTPIVKAYNTEMCNKVAYDTIQIHGGTGFMQEFNAERHARDARITNIYEGTTQLQIVAAIGGVTTGTAASLMDEYESDDFSHAEELHKVVLDARQIFDKTIVGVKDVKDPEFITYHARRLVEMATDIIIAYLLLRDAKKSERKIKVAEIFIEKMLPRVEMSMKFILDGKAVLVKNHKDIIG
jgi:alkylation response protein AidB-like acyl-CoA dehydrogenase